MAIGGAILITDGRPYLSIVRTEYQGSKGACNKLLRNMAASGLVKRIK